MYSDIVWVSSELYKVQFKLSSGHWTQRSIQVQFIGQKLNLNCCSTHHWTFLNWVQSQFKESGVPPAKKKRMNYRILCVMARKKPSFPSFLQGGTPLSLNWLWTQFKKVQWWVEQQFKFSFWPMNWTWIDPQDQGKNWIELRTSIQFWTAIQLWKNYWKFNVPKGQSSCIDLFEL